MLSNRDKYNINTAMRATRIIGTRIKRTKIIESDTSDFFKQLFDDEQITVEQWQLITEIRKLAYRARRSQGIRVRLQSHSQHWGMPHVCAQDTYINAYAEGKWKLFLFYLKPFVNHLWLDKQVLELLVHGGRVLDEDDLSSKVMVNHSSAKDISDLKSEALQQKNAVLRSSDLMLLGFTMDTIQNTLLVIEYVYKKAHRRR